MPKKEHLRKLVKEAIPSTEEGIVNFRALRELLAASIEHQHPAGRAKSNDENDAKTHVHPKIHSALGNNEVKFDHLRDLAEKHFESIFQRFETSLDGLSQQLDRIDERITQLENVDENKNE